MKKVLKNPIFTFIIGAIIFSGITLVIATTVSSHDVTYKNTTVEDAIDDLYSKAKPEYIGNITVTPTTSEQVLSTNNKILKSNITINPIPSTFKELSGEANFTADDLVAGKKAYNNNGELIIGIANKKYSDDEYMAYGNLRYNAGMSAANINSMAADAYGSYIASQAGKVSFDLGFKPRYVFITLVNTTTNTTTSVIYYNEYRSTTASYRYDVNSAAEDSYVLNNNYTGGMHIESINNTGFDYYFSKGDRAIYYIAYR